VSSPYGVKVANRLVGILSDVLKIQYMVQLKMGDG
jgi:hypothetical protein